MREPDIDLPEAESEKEKPEAPPEELNGLLKKTPAENWENAEAAADLANERIEQAGTEKPNTKKKLRFSGFQEWAGQFGSEWGRPFESGYPG